MRVIDMAVEVLRHTGHSNRGQQKEWWSGHVIGGCTNVKRWIRSLFACSCPALRVT